MFRKVTKKVVKEVDGNRTLIPVSSCNESFEILELVIKKKPLWPWQKPTYSGTGFTLNKVLKGDKLIQPDVHTKDFPSLSGITSGDSEIGIGAKLPHDLAKLNVSGKGTSESQMCFSSLKKEWLDMPKLYEDCRDRVLDMTHSLIKQVQEDDKTSFAVVDERIVLTQTSTIRGKGTLCAGVQFSSNVLELCKLAATKATASGWKLDLPEHTTIAFGCTKLELNTDGSFDLRLYTTRSLIEYYSGKPGYPWLKEEVNSLSSHFALLCGLQASTRAALLQHLVSAMKEGGTIYLLERVLSQMRQGERPTLDIVEVNSQGRIIQAILDVLEPSDGGDGAKTENLSSLLVALHLFVSALDEMSDECVADLMSSCTPPAMRCLERLMQCVMDGEEISLSDGDLAPLSEEAESRPERLFSSCDVKLRKDGEVLRAQFSSQPNEPLLCLCIAVKSLAPLVQC